MTVAEALTLRPKDVVVHRETAVRNRPIRVTDVWVNEKRTIVLVRLASVAGQAWLDATGYEFAPKGKVWCKACVSWETKAEQAARHTIEGATALSGALAGGR